MPSTQTKLFLVPTLTVRDDTEFDGSGPGSKRLSAVRATAHHPLGYGTRKINKIESRSAKQPSCVG